MASKMNSWHSYPSIFNLGHASITALLSGDVLVEEKVDGSQFSFGITESGEIVCRSKGAKLHIEAPERMFIKAIESVRDRAHLLHPGWTYRCEYLAKPKHNTLAYNRIPNGHLIIFDVNDGEESYLDYESKAREAKRIGLEVVPMIYRGAVSVEMLHDLLGRESILGGPDIEGVVIKPVGYGLFGLDKKCLLGKFVSESFREINSKELRASNPTSGDIVFRIGQKFQSPARWSKAVQHLRDSSLLLGSPKDIGPLLKEIQSDIEKECTDEIKDMLYEWAWPQIRRMVTHGFPEWYKDELLKNAFDGEQGGNQPNQTQTP